MTKIASPNDVLALELLRVEVLLASAEPVRARAPEPRLDGLAYVGTLVKPTGSRRCGCPPDRHVGRLSLWSGAHHVTTCALYERVK